MQGILEVNQEKYCYVGFYMHILKHMKNNIHQLTSFTFCHSKHHMICNVITFRGRTNILVVYYFNVVYVY